MAFSKARRIDFPRVLDALMILGFSLFFIRILKSGNIYLYVHPRIIPYVKFASFYLFIIIPFLVGSIFRKTPGKADTSSYIIIGFALLLAFTIPPTTLSATNAGDRTGFSGTGQGISNKDTVAAKEQDRSTEPEESADRVTDSEVTDTPQDEEPQDEAVIDEGSSGKDIPDTAESPEEGSAGVTGGQAADEVPQAGEQQDKIVIDEESYLVKVDDMFNNMDAYVGKKIEIGGLVYKEDGMKKDEFVVGRYAMTCCAADLSLAGLLCRSEEGGKLKNDQWIKVEGMIEAGEYGGMAMPVIRVTGMESMQKPEDEYVYP